MSSNIHPEIMSLRCLYSLIGSKYNKKGSFATTHSLVLENNIQNTEELPEWTADRICHR
jgi:hypothetical protein